MLQLQNLSTGFAKKAVTLHQNISMRVDAGKLVLLLGPNGIGKSVLLKTIAGLQTPLSGEVTVNQINIHKTTPEIRASLSSILLATPPAIEQMKVSEMVLSGRQRFITGWKNPSQNDLSAVENAMQNRHPRATKRFLRRTQRWRKTKSYACPMPRPRQPTHPA